MTTKTFHIKGSCLDHKIEVGTGTTTDAEGGVEHYLISGELLSYDWSTTKTATRVLSRGDILNMPAFYNAVAELGIRMQPPTE